MNLYGVHRILVGSAITLGALLALHGGARWRATGDPLGAVLAVLSLAATAGLALYLRWFVLSRGHPRAPR